MLILNDDINQHNDNFEKVYQLTLKEFLGIVYKSIFSDKSSQLDKKSDLRELM